MNTENITTTLDLEVNYGETCPHNEWRGITVIHSQCTQCGIIVED